MRYPLRFAAAIAAGACMTMHLPLASAQQPADPAPPPPADPAQPPPVEPAQPPPAEPAPVAPAPASEEVQPTAPAPAVPLDLPTPPQNEPDKVSLAKKGADKRRPGAAWVRWRGSAVNWSHDVTTTAIGIGRDNIGGEGEVYSQGFGGTFNFFVIDEKDFRLRLTTSAGFDVEMSDGDTTTRNEPRFRDVPLTIATGALTLVSSEDKQWSIGLIPNYTTIFPTSPVSQDRGVILTMSPRLLTYFTAPILGDDSDHLKGVFGGVSLRYDRTFTEANVPVNNALARPRRDPSGDTFFSDQISGNRLGDNTIRVGGFLFFEEKFGPSTLWISGGPSWSVTFLPEFSEVDCLETDTGCVTIANDPDAPNTRINAGFSAGVSYFPSSEFGFDLTYTNNTLQLGEDGQRRDIFYSPDASFSATLIVSVDAIYERIVGDPREDPVIIFGKNSPMPNKTPTGQPAPATATF